MAKETFRDSFKPQHLLKADAICSLKKHYRNILREVVGYLEILANNDTERFVFASVPDITKHCNKFSNGRAPYKQRQVENALEFLRAQNVISGRLERQRFGAVRSGFIVTPHDALCVRTKNVCEFKGAGLVSGSSFATMPGARHWWWIPTNPAVTAAVSSAATPAATPAVLNQESGAQSCGEGCGTDSPQAMEKSNGCSTAKKVLPTVSETSGAPSRVIHSAVKAVEAVDDASQGASAVTSSLKSMNDETIGQHFGLPWPQVDFKAITDGVLNTDTKQWEGFGIDAQYQD